MFMKEQTHIEVLVGNVTDVRAVVPRLTVRNNEGMCVVFVRARRETVKRLVAVILPRPLVDCRGRRT